MLSRVGLWLYIFVICGSFFQFQSHFIKFCKELIVCLFIVAQPLGIIQPLRNAPRGESR